ncbi:SDR family NAD(P)-dependent oxidoreductase [Anoxynatronum buryatiense]|uniref:3-oxoacyl-[acyl-carrier protein] reductase n=1 Tax=Anoxynatronum buryatiense TaxID=489973 RepID=A0AA46AK59_9CLOT|nr:SDR family oxidoreductase [Anoxynatronum buryatiense]SMP67497.1 3-oxoacyl-[acyl-carrier protein] reductase [Anoxynatronum buryatiense]
MIMVITGTRKGIGKGIALHYLEKGHMVLGCSRGEGTIEHPRYRHYQADVSNDEQVQAMVKSIRQQENQVDVLINNAGAAAMNHLLLTPTAKARQLLEVNTLGTMVMTREMCRLLRRSPGGRIVNFTTVAVPLNLEGEAVYAASKAAVETLTRIGAKELAPYGITVNAVGPAPVKTDLIAGVPEEKIQGLLKQQAIHAFGTIEDVIHVIDFFVKPESRMITGQVVYLGGVF